MMNLMMDHHTGDFSFPNCENPIEDPTSLPQLNITFPIRQCKHEHDNNCLYEINCLLLF